MKKNKLLISLAFFFVLSSFQTFSQINENTDIGWRILDEDKCKTIIKFIKDYYSKSDESKVNSINFSDQIIVFQEYGEMGKDKPIKGLLIGTSKIESNDQVRIILGEELFDFIKDRGRYPYQYYSTPDVKKRELCHVRGDHEVWWIPLNYNNSILITGPYDLHFIGLVDERWWGIEACTGINELNYPSIFSGSARVGIVLEKFRMGLQFPLGFGKDGILGSRNRLLDAGIGAYLGFNEEINNRIQVFGNLFYSDLTKRLWNQVQNENGVDTTFFLTFGGNLGLSFNSNILLGLGVTLKFSVGGEFHQVGLGFYDENKKLQRISAKPPIDPDETSYPTIVGSPFIRVDVYDCENAKYHLYLQYTNLSLSLGGWYAINENFDIGLTTVFTELLRRPKKWEYSSLMIPQIRIRF